LLPSNSHELGVEVLQSPFEHLRGVHEQEQEREVKGPERRFVHLCVKNIFVLKRTVLEELPYFPVCRHLCQEKEMERFIGEVIHYSLVLLKPFSQKELDIF